MESKEKNKFSEAYVHLEQALEAYKHDTDNKALAFLTVSKAFEVLVEYAWKKLRHMVMDEGLDASSPKEAVRQAAKLGFIDKPDKWIDCINARNDSVHDYFGIPQEDYIKLAEQMLDLVKKIK